MTFIVQEAERTPSGHHRRNHRSEYKSLEEAREHFESVKRVSGIYWAGLYEQKSPSHSAVKLDSFCK